MSSLSRSEKTINLMLSSGFSEIWQRCIRLGRVGHRSWPSIGLISFAAGPLRSRSIALWKLVILITTGRESSLIGALRGAKCFPCCERLQRPAANRARRAIGIYCYSARSTCSSFVQLSARLVSDSAAILLSRLNNSLNGPCFSAADNVDFLG